MVLTKEEFLANLKSRVGDDTSDEALKYLEDMTDTFNDLTKKAQGNKKTDEEWEKELKAKDEEWRIKYRERFFNSDASNGGKEDDPLLSPPKEEPKPEETVTIDDLFSEKGSK